MAGHKKKRLEATQGDLNFLAKANHTQRKKMLKSKSKAELKTLIDCLSDLAHNMLYEQKFVSQLTDVEKRKLRKHVPNLKVLTGEHSLKKKHTLISSQKGGGLLGSNWNAVKSLFGSA